MSAGSIGPTAAARRSSSTSAAVSVEVPVTGSGVSNGCSLTPRLHHFPAPSEPAELHHRDLLACGRRSKTVPGITPRGPFEERDVEFVNPVALVASSRGGRGGEVAPAEHARTLRRPRLASAEGGHGAAGGSEGDCDAACTAV